MNYFFQIIDVLTYFVTPTCS